MAAAVVAAVVAAGLLVAFGVRTSPAAGGGRDGVAEAGVVCDVDGDSVQDEGAEEATP